MKKIIFLASIFILFFVKNIFALSIHPTLGIHSYYLNNNDPDFKNKSRWDPLKASSIAAGLATNYNNIILGTTTNRILNRSTTGEIESKKSGQYFQSKISTTTDTFYTGYKIQRWQPKIFISNVNLDRRIYRNNILLKKYHQSAILPGLNLGYSLTRNIQASAIYIFPNRELSLESGFGLGLNYIF